MPSNIIRHVEGLATQEKYTTALVFLDRHRHPSYDDTLSRDEYPDDENSALSSSSDEDTNVVDSSRSNIIITGIMSGDNNTN